MNKQISNWLLKKIYYYGYYIALLYWLIFKPKTHGTKCVVEHQGKWLLIQNSYGLEQDKWTFPGGGVKHKETPEDTIKRELEEEVRLQPQTLQKLGELTVNFEYKQDTVSCFFAQVNQTNFEIDHTEVVNAVWFSKTDLPPLNRIAHEILTHFFPFKES